MGSIGFVFLEAEATFGSLRGGLRQDSSTPGGHSAGRAWSEGPFQRTAAILGLFFAFVKGDLESNDVG